jgi:hypothetical protein
MALLFPWATKEYLLWEMTIGQIFLYYQYATDIKCGKESKTEPTPNDISELKKIRDQMREDAKKKYGDI